MTRALIRYSIVAALFGALLVPAIAGASEEPWRPKPKAGEPLAAVLAQQDAESPGRALKAWVFFTDKGFTSELGFMRERLKTVPGLDPRARVRRDKMGHDWPVGFHDFAVPAAYVDAVIAAGATKRVVSRYLNAVSVQAPIATLGTIAALPFVSSVEPVRGGTRPDVTPDRPAPAGKTRSALYNLDYGPSLGQLDMIQVPTLHDLGYDATGVRICLLDTGFKRTHNALASVNVIAEHDFINNDGNTSYEPGDPSGQFDHGTKILSLIGGYAPGELIGPAYNAEFLLGKTEDYSQEVPIEEDYWVAGIEWADSLGADIVSSSLGYSDWYTYVDMDGNTAVTTIAADLAAWNGILVCTSAGNEGDSPWTYIIAPADADSTIATGAVWDDETIAYFSSRGPTYDGRIKPDLCAQGVYDQSIDPSSNTAYSYCHGTSCSNPLLAGAAALLLQANPFLTPQEVIQKLKSTASRAASPDTAYGWGVIRTADALDVITAVEDASQVEAFGRNLPPRTPALVVTAAPNPFNPTVELTIEVEFGTLLRVRIVDARGAIVDTIFAAGVEAGTHRVMWDGTNTGGRAVSSGIYFAVVESAGVKVVKKLSLVR